MHPLETGDSHKMWTENRGQVTFSLQHSHSGVVTGDTAHSAAAAGT